MTITFTFGELILVLFFILGTAIGIYLLIVLKNANQLINNANNALTRNEESITNLLFHLEGISGNTALFSEELKKQFANYETVVNSIIRTGAESMLMISDTTDRIRTLTGNFNEIIKTVNRIFKK